MKHSNPQVIDHVKKDLYQALTGKSEKTHDFVKKNLTDIVETAEINGNLEAPSHVLFLIMTHPTLKDEEKMVLAMEFGKDQGREQGAMAVCHNCMVGPASKLLHSFMGDDLKGEP